VNSRLDRFSAEERSSVMRAVKSKDTTPELAVRSLLHRMGYRFRLYRKDLPGSPDIVLSRHKLVVLVHGCFWHRHEACPRASTPATRQSYWIPKFKRTVARDNRNRAALKEAGWRVVVVWECEITDLVALERRLSATLRDPANDRACE